jgi:hypothetical protein
MQYPSQLQGNIVDGFQTASVENLEVAEPFLQVEIQAPNPTAWLWCAP